MIKNIVLFCLIELSLPNTNNSINLPTFDKRASCEPKASIDDILKFYDWLVSQRLLVADSKSALAQCKSKCLGSSPNLGKCLDEAAIKFPGDCHSVICDYAWSVVKHDCEDHCQA